MKIALKKHKSETHLITNDLILDKELSLIALKLWFLINTKPDEWNFSIDELSEDFKEDKKDVKAAKFELETRGYLRKDISQNYILSFISYEKEHSIDGELGGAYQLLDQADFSTRTYKCFINEEIKYLGELIRFSENDLLRTANFGQKTLAEVKEFLSKKDLWLGMKIPQFVLERMKIIKGQKCLNN